MPTPPDDPRALALALAEWPFLDGASVRPLGAGLINRTFGVTGGAGDSDGNRYVLQRLNTIFDPRIHENIRAVTERLAARGLTTPRLVPTARGPLCAELGDAHGTWRLMTHVAGRSFDTLASPSQARAAASLIARFHAALDGLDHEFVGLRVGVHDTPRHLATLAAALAAHPSHRLAAEVLPLGRAILDAAAALPPLPPLPPRVCHGDLKINNVLFDERDDTRAVCLVDLDTVGPLALAYELGDAWRSWCNPHGEDRVDGIFDLDVFAASLAGYSADLGRALSVDERRALLGGVEWVSLELAARFAADALDERYFGWDRSRFAGAGEHNLVRARSQWAVHRACVDCRRERASLLGLAADQFAGG